MIFLGDYFALGLVIVLSLFFFDNRTSLRHLPATSKLFIGCLFFTALTAATDLWTGYLMEIEGVVLWVNMLANASYFIFNIMATSCIALYLFVRILEHTHDKHCMKMACGWLAGIFVAYLGLVVANTWNGWLFYFDKAGNYYRGVLNGIGYFVVVAQMILVAICFFRNRQNASRLMHRVMWYSFPPALMSIIVQRIYPDVLLNAFLLALMNTVLFLNFQGQRQGVHKLTRLNDRHTFFKEIDYRIKEREPFQVFLIDVKNFSFINQKYGHLFGDELLYHFAFELEKLLPDSLSFHMNGTAFAVVLRYTYQSVADRQSGQLLDFLEKGVFCGDICVPLESVMVHYVADGLESGAADIYESLEYAADKGYENKQSYIRCTREVREEMLRRRYVQDRLRTVDRMHGYEVWYQPIKCLANDRFCSMEALVRLREPDGSMLSPGEFIPLAEQTGQISAITWFVLDEVCHTLKYSSRLNGVSVSINLPMDQLLEKGFVSRFISTVDQAGIDHSCICIEVTERVMLDTFQDTLRIMEQMTEAGFRFYLDDFGAGYSNFNCLLQLPFKVIKLDACLKKNRRGGQPDYGMIRTMTRMFHDMDLVLVAEGAENENEVATLAKLGVDRVQGFALARPMPRDQLLDFYQQQPWLD